MKENYIWYDQVLYDNISKMSIKLPFKWVGSWTIMEVLFNRSYHIANHMRIHKTVINNDYLKLFKLREIKKIVKINI